MRQLSFNAPGDICPVIFDLTTVVDSIFSRLLANVRRSGKNDRSAAARNPFIHWNIHINVIIFTFCHDCTDLRAQRLQSPMKPNKRNRKQPINQLNIDSVYFIRLHFIPPRVFYWKVVYQVGCWGRGCNAMRSDCKQAVQWMRTGYIGPEIYAITHILQASFIVSFSYIK